MSRQVRQNATVPYTFAQPVKEWDEILAQTRLGRNLSLRATAKPTDRRLAASTSSSRWVGAVLAPPIHEAETR